MKKIIILQIPNANNNGSAMMAINTIDTFSNIYKNEIEFFCDFSTESDKNRICSELSQKVKAQTLDLPVFDRGANIFTSFTRRLPWIKNVIKVIGMHKPHAVIVLGGDDFSEYYSGYKIVVRLYLMYRLSKYFPVYMLGHTIGPFNSWRKAIARIFLDRCRILTRDKTSAKYCTDVLRLKHVIEGHDLAWLDLPKQFANKGNCIMDRYGIELDKYIVLIPSSLVGHYTSSQSDYFDTWVNLIEQFRKHETLSNYKIVLMPHVFSDKKKDDRWAISEICKQLSNKSNFIPIYEMLLPSECRSLLGNGILSISCRMHSAVSTIQMGKPSIAFSYSVKYAGVIGHDVGLKKLVIEARNDKLWNGELIKIVSEKVDYILNNYTEITEEIISRVDIIKKEQVTILNRYAEIIDRNKGVPFN